MKRRKQRGRGCSDVTSGAAASTWFVVLKVFSADILHRSDIGGVRLGIADRTAAKAAFDAILSASRRTPRSMAASSSRW